VFSGLFSFPQRFHNEESAMTPAPISFSHKSHRTSDSPIAFFIQQAIENPHLISLAAGLVDEPSLPVEPVAAAVAQILATTDSARAALQYGSTQGLHSLREKALQLVCEADGVKPSELNLSTKDVVLTTGSQQLLYLLGELLLDPGDIVITEAPSYFVYHAVLESMDVRVLTVPMDEHGMNTDALEERLKHLEHTNQLDRVKLIYTVDYFQNPTGLTLTLARRQHLLELAQRFSKKHRILVLEDAAYRELRFDGPDLPSIKSFDERNEFVISTYTFSKPCAPGLKTGYGIMPREFIQPLLNLKGNHDFGSCNFVQHIIDQLLETGAYDRHVKQLRSVYKHKRDVMRDALEQQFGDLEGASWTNPQGGFYFWLTLPDEVNTGPDGELVKVAVREGVIYVPGEFGHVAVEGKIPNNEARLCYGVVEPDEIPEAIRRLRAAVDAVVRRPVMV